MTRSSLRPLKERVKTVEKISLAVNDTLQARGVAVRESAAHVAVRLVAPPPPAPRMIVPQTGPRPVYKAPLRPAPPLVQPGVPIGANRPVPGRPVPGQPPSFQRRPPASAAGGPPAHVHRFVPESEGRCTPRDKLRQERVRWALARRCRLPGRRVPGAVPVRLRAGPASVMFRAA